jgi:predicted CXXCH cytochrome family protein
MLTSTIERHAGPAPRPRRFLGVGALSVLTVLVVCAPARARAQSPVPSANACLACHATLKDARLSRPTTLFAQADVHREKGFACVDCHGGNATALAAAQAHAPASGFKGKPSGATIISTCARCHSDAELMRRYAPKQRVDQAAEYATSVHGKRLAGGDTNVATCVSCHGAHGVRLVSDAKSPVFPTNVAVTCAGCHADAKHMAGYKLADGSALPTNQLADYLKSVHYNALTKGNDLSAPTCNDCHGNHGAAPPGVGSIANVCGTCHAVFAQKFETSVHKQIFDKGCVECHSNHAVLKPSDEMLAATGHGICAPCHSPQDKADKGAAAAAAMRGQIDGLKSGIERSNVLLATLKNSGIEVGDDELALHEANSKLTQARTEMHAFDPPLVGVVIAEGTQIVKGVDESEQRGVGELQFRRRGLAWSLGAILLLVVGLVLKVRQIDKRRERA